MENEEIVLFACLQVKKGFAEQAKQAALDIIEESRAEAGCINYDFHQSIDDENLFMWHETWRDMDAVTAHGQSSHLQRFSKAIENITESPLEVILTKAVNKQTGKN